VRWDAERADRQMSRFARVAREACGQSRRLHLPSIELSDVVTLRGQGAVLAEPGGRTLASSDRMVLVGPEGGWTPDELDGSDTVSLGPNVLRGETAALAAGVLLTALRVGLAPQTLPSSP
jgi:16S rRNA (uracil1498-N3)-methyltransferase